MSITSPTLKDSSSLIAAWYPKVALARDTIGTTPTKSRSFNAMAMTETI